MSAESAYLALVLTAFITFFLVITAVWFINRMPPRRSSATIQAFPARRPSATNEADKAA